eukprot:TRINITY_DN3654_c0_g1_i1.p1 TRINITY_DN3654_c0_g1~~TRINITY_DN3654_c0_g1_i1.p1  ORF type:complete len:423 (+),score=109.69 TRINITY_DN3654_c0_g1_i1:47-1315(+)
MQSEATIKDRADIIKRKAQNFLKEKMQEGVILYEKAKAADPRVKAAAGVAISFTLLLLSLLGWKILTALLLFLGSIAAVVKTQWEHVRRIGIINFLPEELRKTLLERSVFDLLCDIWFVPKLSIYLKVLVQPFLVKLPPEDAIRYLDGLYELDGGRTRRRLLVKGVINNLPPGARNLLLPAVEATPALVPAKAEEKEMKKHSAMLHLEESTARPPSEEHLSEEEVRPAERISRPLAVQPKPFSLSRLLSQQSAEENQTRPIVRISSNKRFKDEASEPKSQIILSSSMLSGRKKEIPLAENWDKLHIYNRLRSEKQLRVPVKTEQKERAPQNAKMVGPLRILQQVVELQSKLNIRSIDSGKVLKTFAISSLILVSQLALSKRVRGWFKQTLILLAYIVAITFSSTSIGLLALKYIRRARAIKN